MKKSYLYEKISEIDERYIVEAMDPPRFGRKKKFSFGKGLTLAAACLALLTAMVALPMMLKDDDDILIPGPDIIDFNTPEYADFEIEGSTIVAYKGEGCESLTIPNGIEAIAEFAFLGNENAKNIKVISIASTVKNIDNNAFAGCSELQQLIVGENSEFTEQNGLLMTKNGETIVKYTNPGDVKSITIPKGVKYISAHAFQGSELSEVIFNEGLLYIGFNAFASLEITEIHLPSTLLELEEGAFSGCIYATEGSYPKGLKIGENAFDIVPFYLSLLAGAPCPHEDILKNNVTIAEAFAKSDSELITAQFNDIFEFYKTGTISGESFCYSAIMGAPELPESTELPGAEDIEFSSLKIVERAWSSQTNADIIIPLVGKYDIIIGYRLYDRFSPMYWSDIKWRVENISFVPKDAAADADIAFGDWYISMIGNDTDGYSSISFTNKDGKSYTEERFPSTEKYRFILSPDGERFIVEYSSGGWNFFIEDLSGKLYNTWWSYDAPCVPYYSKVDGAYLPGTAMWNTSPDTMEQYPIIAENIQGRFLMDFSHELIRNNTL
ncbi:MAG: leucine-rich repeat domain-containing protein, partial [Clostridia bacterium]|nr:leucine-rich repeat domain-containing protein [Clostridia bacterium]